LVRLKPGLQEPSSFFNFRIEYSVFYRGMMAICLSSPSTPRYRNRDNTAAALQGFFQNLAMLLAVGSYTFAAAHNITPVFAMFMLGLLVFGATFLVSLHLPNNQKKQRTMND